MLTIKKGFQKNGQNLKGTDHLNMKSCISQIAIYVTIANSYLPHFFSTLKTYYFKLKSYINK